jgi:hypothetical protein
MGQYCKRLLEYCACKTVKRNDPYFISVKFNKEKCDKIGLQVDPDIVQMYFDDNEYDSQTSDEDNVRAIYKSKGITLCFQLTSRCI